MMSSKSNYYEMHDDQKARHNNTAIRSVVKSSKYKNQDFSFSTKNKFQSKHKRSAASKNNSFSHKPNNAASSDQDNLFISSIISDSKENSRKMPVAKNAGVNKLNRKYYEVSKPTIEQRAYSKFFGKDEKCVNKKKYQFKTSISEAIGNKIAVVPDSDALAINEKLNSSVYSKSNKTRELIYRSPATRKINNMSYKEIDSEKLNKDGASHHNILIDQNKSTSGYISFQNQRPKTAGIQSKLRSNQTAKDAIDRVLTDMPSNDNKVEIVPYAEAPSYDEFEMQMSKIQLLKNAYSVNNTAKSIKPRQRLAYRDPPKLARKRHRLNTLECIKPKHAKKIVDFAGLFKLFSSVNK